MLNQANTALELAQARYKVGLSGIVDLTQAQLAQTEAQIEFTNARYTYQTALADGALPDRTVNMLKSKLMSWTVLLGVEETAFRAFAESSSNRLHPAHPALSRPATACAEARNTSSWQLHR